ncbi:bifunctional 4-hydroxy-2-oxoglutarate aldolase/2-dehydro-3-deoxy-phosphogluconate aldolase [Phenylobacterium immobile]|uniref:bifunctional 4-hydroxy-2-oxoglutarate aldolase/2-dehydro-3-deoxy-phosphogluconate aldolase n=1 Tax=Phenylobacterium immobile TaxID=21 RepID=UPI000ADC2966|nr:bifunctional 4-hydroxy-2-oxoglutarate aldolase/2-dehydro-3-deoxy-phosphogluconate aldolase [Phenylobacterium immobile]
MMKIEDIMGLAPVIPVLIIEDSADAVPLARALVAGGLFALEVTLRTPVALDCIARIAGEVEGAVVGAGTAINHEDLRACAEAGAKFIVSPGLIEGERAEDGPVARLPAVATGTELIAGIAQGFRRFKLFPADVAGGAKAIKAFESPFQQVKFCPTGGVTPANAPDYLALANVACVGGSWVAPANLLRAKDWAAITARAAEAAALQPRHAGDTPGA